jgi:hypothetical protein
LQIGASNPFSDSAGTLTLQNVDAIDATTESTIETAIDTLANLGSIQGVAFTFGAYAATLLNNANEAAFKAAVNLEAGTDYYSVSGADAAFQPLDSDLTAIAALATTAAGRSVLTIADPNADRLIAWDDSVGAMAAMALADLTAEGTPAAGDFILIYGAEGDLRKVDWADLPGAGGGISNISEDVTPQLGGDLDTNAFHIVFSTGTAIRTGTSAANTALLQAYDVDGASYTTFATLTAGNTPTMDLASAVTIGGAAIYRAGGTDVALADGGTGASLSDPNADRILFWDDSGGAVTWLTPGTGLAISTTTMSIDKAAASDVWAATSNKFLSADLIESASAAVAMTDAATVTFDWDAGFYRTLQITTDRVLGNPTNGQPGTFRTIHVTSDGGPDALTFGNQYGGSPPVLTDISTTKSYTLFVFCKTTTQFLVSAIDGTDA